MNVEPSHLSHAYGPYMENRVLLPTVQDETDKATHNMAEIGLILESLLQGFTDFQKIPNYDWLQWLALKINQQTSLL